MPYNSDIEKRNRAIVAFLILTAVRVEALVSLKLKHMLPVVIILLAPAPLKGNPNVILQLSGASGILSALISVYAISKNFTLCPFVIPFKHANNMPSRVKSDLITFQT